jgi:Ca2+-binding EF-hand superfamily protein
LHFRNQIQAGINRRDGEFLHSVFERKTNTSGTSSLTNQQFITAMEELGIRKKEDDFKILFRTMDMNNDMSHGPGHIVQCVLQR